MIIGKPGIRHLHVFMTLSAITTAYITRVNMSVAIVAMTGKSQPSDVYAVYDWNEQQKSQVLSAFFWGYILPQIAVGNIGEKFGTWRLLLGAMSLSSMLNIAVPFIAEYGYFVVCLSRMMLGISQGVFFPCCTALLAKWIPPAERTNAYAITFNGCNCGLLIGLLLCGSLAASSGGWPSIFFVTAGIAAAWSILWFVVGASTPDEHSFISVAEADYIREALSSTSADNFQPSTRTPWNRIATSPPLWAILICHSCHNWGQWILATEIPTYIHSILGVDIQQNGLLSSLPYLIALLTTFIISSIATCVNRSKILSPTAHRKIWNSVAEWGSALSLLCLTRLKTHDLTSIVSLLTVTVALNSACMTGFLTNHVDLSPNFCGTLMGITNTLSTIGSIFGPLSVGWIVNDTTSNEQWNMVFYLTIGILFVGNIVYLIFASSEVQSWNDVEILSRKNARKIEARVENTK